MKIDNKEIDEFNIPVSGWKQLIEDWIFDERNREILKEKLLDGKTYGELAGKYHLEVRQLEKIIGKGVKTIRRHM